jgi:hypothetical protein
LVQSDVAKNRRDVTDGFGCGMVGGVNEMMTSKKKLKEIGKKCITYNCTSFFVQDLIKFPTIILGIPQSSRRMVNEKQQLINPSSV